MKKGGCLRAAPSVGQRHPGHDPLHPRRPSRAHVSSSNDLRKILDDRVGNYVTSMPASKVKGIIESFGTAVRRVVEAGFDVAQVHGDRMLRALFGRAV